MNSVPIPHSDGTDSVLLCATHRLARNLRLAFGQRQIEAGAARWPTLQATTVDAWLHDIGEQISLLGEIPADMMPSRVLSAFQESLVWKQAIEAVGSDDPALALFDLHSLAKTAAEAHALLGVWRLQLADENEAANDWSEETRQFLAWRKRFRATCQKNGWIDSSEYQRRILGWLDRGAGTLPARVVFAGFDTRSPQLVELQAILARRGVYVATLEPPTTSATHSVAVACDDAESECRAAAAWAKEIRDTRPGARIGIVVADLEARRSTLVPLLDEALNPAALTHSDAASPAQYNLSLGLPLTRDGMVRTALALLRLLGKPQGIALTEFGDLLRLPYWSADQSEADVRALIDAKLRERPGQNLTIKTVLRLVRSFADGGQTSQLARHLDALDDTQSRFTRSPTLRKPHEWAKAFRESLTKVGWPGERTLSSSEFQTRAAFFETLDAFADLDAFLGAVSISVASSELTRLCKEKIFQPKTLGQPTIQVLGLLEATGAEFDALWVMGMNDQHWPPPARPNPLLPAELQRLHRTPGASAEVQADFARAIHLRLLHGAPDICFSFAQKDGERELRPSPLLDGMNRDAQASAVAPLSARFVHLDSADDRAAAFEYRADHQAPPLAEGEKVSGGSGLLKAQAICPAWAFYRYRLGAKQLETPTEGLDASRRGTMVHAMLEAFWKTVGDSLTFEAMTDTALQAALTTAVESALSGFEADIGEPMTPRFRQLEARRLQRLGLQWLAVERRNPATGAGRAPFRVIACEEKHTVSLGHLHINLVIDRIDELIDDGRRIVLDYKTGAVDASSWHEARLIEPQLPLYAAIVLGGPDQPQVAAVAFARVKLGDCQFKGVAAESHVLPGVDGLRLVPLMGEPPMSPLPPLPPLSPVADPWQTLLGQWQDRLAAIAEEIHRGEAAVRFADPADLRYCEVLPLLRLTERQQQFEVQEARP